MHDVGKHAALVVIRSDPRSRVPLEVSVGSKVPMHAGAHMTPYESTHVKYNESQDRAQNPIFFAQVQQVFAALHQVTSHGVVRSIYWL